jgi:hypothetical protein
MQKDEPVANLRPYYSLKKEYFYASANYRAMIEVSSFKQATVLLPRSAPNRSRIENSKPRLSISEIQARRSWRMEG